MIDWLIDCLLFYVPLKNFSFIWRRHHYQWRLQNLGLCSAIRAFEQGGVFIVPHRCDTGPRFFRSLSREFLCQLTRVIRWHTHSVIFNILISDQNSVLHCFGSSAHCFQRDRAKWLARTAAGVSLRSKIIFVPYCQNSGNEHCFWNDIGIDMENASSKQELFKHSVNCPVKETSKYVLPMSFLLFCLKPGVSLKNMLMASNSQLIQ
jgi:hypothetical protein